VLLLRQLYLNTIALYLAPQVIKLFTDGSLVVFVY